MVQRAVESHEQITFGFVDIDDFRAPLAVRRGDGVERVELLPLRREATGDDLCAGQRQEPDACLLYTSPGTRVA